MAVPRPGGRTRPTQTSSTPTTHRRALSPRPRRPGRVSVREAAARPAADVRRRGLAAPASWKPPPPLRGGWIGWPRVRTDRARAAPPAAAASLPAVAPAVLRPAAPRRPLGCLHRLRAEQRVSSIGWPVRHATAAIRRDDPSPTKGRLRRRGAAQGWRSKAPYSRSSRTRHSSPVPRSRRSGSSLRRRTGTGSCGR